MKRAFLFLALFSSRRQQSQVPGSLYGLGYLSLVFSTKVGFFSGPNFAHTRYKTAEQIRFFKINLLNIFFAEITICHNLYFIKLNLNDKIQMTNQIRNPNYKIWHLIVWYLSFDI